MNRNARYFSVSEDGVALSTYGQKVLSHLTEEEIIEEVQIVNPSATTSKANLKAKETMASPADFSAKTEISPTKPKETKKQQ